MEEEEGLIAQCCSETLPPTRSHLLVVPVPGPSTFKLPQLWFYFYDKIYVDDGNLRKEGFILAHSGNGPPRPGSMQRAHGAEGYAAPTVRKQREKVAAA